MTDFETQVVSAIQKSIVKTVSEGNWLNVPYDERVKMPKSLLEDCWKLVDVNKLSKQIAERIESELAERIVNHMAAEIATDVKSILSVKERREALRSVARAHMDTILKAGTLQVGDK